MIGMANIQTLYRRLPKFIKPFVRKGFYLVTEGKTEEDIHASFVNEFFDSQNEYETYINEFEQGQVAELRRKAISEYKKLTGQNSIRGGIGTPIARDYYAVTRSLQPTTIVETGVCNGLSTLAVLLGLNQNGVGELYSIDYPFHADEPLEEFRAETFDGYGGAAIPSDKDPGWIIPERLRDQWELIIGKSQRKLPHLLTEIENLNLFIHDSEHSHPCMMFEYELAYEWLNQDGIILSDDIQFNDAFSEFTRVRDVDYGKLSRNVGYLHKVNHP